MVDVLSNFGDVFARMFDKDFSYFLNIKDCFYCGERHFDERWKFTTPYEFVCFQLQLAASICALGVMICI